MVCVSLVMAVSAAQGQAQGRKSIKPLDNDNPLKELSSGYYFAPLQVRAMQDDDFDNPGFRWVVEGERLWRMTEGGAGKNCGSCHETGAGGITSAAASYPKYYEPLKKLINLEQRVNLCRTQYMKTSPWQYESNELLAMTAFLRRLSRGKPVDVEVSGPARIFFAYGADMYNKRMGQLDMSCANCHNENYGKKFGGETLSQGQSNGYPAYRLHWRSVGSLHRRFRECAGLARAEPYPYGSDEYVALELYIAWRGRGLPVEAPSVR
jgi:sulfur-oxidizing protein SoxA